MTEWNDYDGPIVAYKRTVTIMEPVDAERACRSYNRWLKRFRFKLLIATVVLWGVSILMWRFQGLVVFPFAIFIPFLIMWGFKEPELMRLPEDEETDED